MYASREYVLAQLKIIRDNVSAWIQELEEVDHPEGVSVQSMENIPEDQFRAELALMGSNLHSLATTN